MFTATSPGFDVDYPGFFAFLRHYNTNVIGNVEISRRFYDTSSGDFRNAIQVLRLRSVCGPNLGEQWDLRVKFPVGKQSELGVRSRVLSAIIPSDVIEGLLKEPVKIFKPEVLPQSILGRLSSDLLAQIGEIGMIATYRHFIGINDLLVSADENIFGDGERFYTVRVYANEFDGAKARLGGILDELKIAHTESVMTNFARLLDHT